MKKWWKIIIDVYKKLGMCWDIYFSYLLAFFIEKFSLADEEEKNSKIKKDRKYFTHKTNKKKKNILNFNFFEKKNDIRIYS